MNQPILSVQGTRVSFGGLVALNNISMNVQEGHIHALVGPNGAGKTTLLNCISGFNHPDSGRIIFAGEEIQDLAPHKVPRLGIGRTFQNLELSPSLSALDNIRVGRSQFIKAGIFSQLIYYGKAKREEDLAEDEALEVMGFLGIRSTKNKFVSQLPFVTRKLVEIARALTLRPKLLLLDEPVSGMNTQESMEMARIVKDIKREMYMTILLVEHDMDLVMDTADMITVLDYGTNIAQGIPSEIKENPEVIKAFLGE